MKHRSEIDGLRAIAVIPVILFHAGFKSFSGGFVGVDIFFVISGFLITTILLTDLKAGSFSIIEFYERRSRRILPALFLVMLACIPLAWFWLLPQDIKRFSQSLIAVSLFASNIYFSKKSGYFDTATELKPFIHTWSLSVEEQYYVIFPLLLILLWKFGRNWVAISIGAVALISIGRAQFYPSHNPYADFYLLHTRAWELMIGAILAFFITENSLRKHNTISSQILSLVGLILIAYSIFTYNDHTPFPGVYTLAPTIGAVLIIAFAGNHTVVGKLLSQKLFVGIGLISYSAYLWHQPIFAFAHQRYFEPNDTLMTILTVSLFPIAYLSWRFVERPFRNKQKFSRKQIFLLAFLGSMFFIGAGLCIPKLDENFSRLKTRSVNGETGQAEFYHYIKSHFPDCSDSTIRNSSPYFEKLQMCQQSKTGSPDIAILGDSHAEHLFYGLQKELPAANVAYYVHWEKPYLSNHTFDNIYKSLSRPDSPKTIVISMHYFGRLDPRNNDLYPNFRALVSHLKNLNKNIVLVGDVPKYPVDADNCKYIRSFSDPLAQCVMSKETARKQQALYHSALKAIATEFSIEFIDIYPVFCDSDKCYMSKNNQLLYRDNNHINRFASHLVGKHLISNSKILQKFSHQSNSQIPEEIKP